ncbi:MAG: DUF4097 family beta strand repeat-containing protein [Gemmatimonadota bacterium]|mgnify:CR=1 FL=1
MLRTTLLATMLCATAAVAAPAEAQQNRSSRDQDYQSRIDTTFAFDRRGTVSLTLYQGEVIVTAWNREEVRVRARSERNEIRMDAAPSRLSLELARPRTGDSRYEVTVPVGVRVVARAQQGDISVTGTRAGVELNTQSGDIVVDDVTDIIDLSSLTGDITARALTGRVEARTTGGEVTLVDVKGDVEATSISGDITLRNVLTRWVRAKSTSGDVTFDGGVDSTGRYELGSHSGSVALLIPAGTGAQLTVATYTGSIDSDFPITLKPGEHGIGATKRFTFDIGKGDARISAESFSGDITIRSKGRRPQD